MLLSRGGAVSKRSARRPGESRREILLAPPLMTIRFLHMGSLFKRNPDIWQVIQGQKYKKSSISELKLQKTVIFYTLSIAANSIVGLSQFCVINVFGRTCASMLERLDEELIRFPRAATASRRRRIGFSRESAGYSSIRGSFLPNSIFTIAKRSGQHP